MDKIKKITDEEKHFLIKTIEQNTDINVLNIIIRLINKSYFFGNEIKNETIEEEIKKDAEIDSFL